MHVLSEILLIPLLELLCMAHKNSILALSPCQINLFEESLNWSFLSNNTSWNEVKVRRF